MQISKIFFNKKADMSARKIIFYIVVTPLLVITFFLIVWLSSSNEVNISEIPIGLENYLIVQRFFNSPSCFIFIDKDTNRAYPLVIDPTRFNQDNFNKCYNAEDTKVKAYRLTLNYANTKRTINSKNWEGFIKKAETKQILVYNEGNLQKAEFLVELQDAK